MMKYRHYEAMLVTALLLFVFMPGIARYSRGAATMINVFINGNQVGMVKDAQSANRLVREARRRLAAQTQGLLLIDYDMVLNGTTQAFGSVDDDEEVIGKIVDVFTDSVMKTKQPVYEVKINQFTVNLSSSQEVLELLKASKAPYDENEEFQVEIVPDPARELNVLTTNVYKTGEAVIGTEDLVTPFPTAGALKSMHRIYDNAFSQGVESYDFGNISLDFGENVEVVQAYVDASQISTLSDAIDMVTKQQEKSQIYEVESGDTLSVIAEKNNMTVADIIAMNSELIKDENSTIRIGDELTVSSPQPELSVMRKARTYYEENYDAPTEYIDNDEWYTNQSKVIVQPVTGFRKVVADVLYHNNAVENTDIVYEDVVVEAVAKVVERGTKIPPTYIRPLSGGRVTSGFGYRNRPTKGASSYHKGVDFGVPTGTAVMASAYGTVIKAGWMSGYGYAIYIQHPDGKVTRYGHLSKILVKNGQSVSQGQKIALSGNTGVSTGPHLHFEILVGGSQVNPLKYIN